MFRPTASRLPASARPLARAPIAARALPRPALVAQPNRFKRGFAAAAPPPPPPATPPPPPPSQSGGAGFNPAWLTLAVLLGLGGAGYYYLKPVITVAQKAGQAIDTAKSGAGAATDHFASIAQAALPPGAFALYSVLAKQEGGITGFLTNLKDKDVQSVIDEVKKQGGDDAKRIIEKVEKKFKEAGGKVSDVDWKALAIELKKELPESQQHMVDMFIGKIPGKEDFDAYVQKAKEMGQDKLKEVEASAKKILDKVEAAQKNGKGQADAFLQGLKEAAPNDVDGLIKQLKEAAKNAGLPADQAEQWLKSKAEDGKVNAEQAGKQLVDRLRTAAKFIPGNPKDVTDQVAQLSPSLAKLLQQAMQQADIVDEKGNRK